MCARKFKTGHLCFAEPASFAVRSLVVCMDATVAEYTAGSRRPSATNCSMQLMPACRAGGGLRVRGGSPKTVLVVSRPSPTIVPDICRVLACMLLWTAGGGLCVLGGSGGLPVSQCVLGAGPLALILPGFLCLAWPVTVVRDEADRGVPACAAGRPGVFGLAGVLDMRRGMRGGVSLSVTGRFVGGVSSIRKNSNVCGVELRRCCIAAGSIAPHGDAITAVGCCAVSCRACLCDT